MGCVIGFTRVLWLFVIIIIIIIICFSCPIFVSKKMKEIPNDAFSYMKLKEMPIVAFSYRKKFEEFLGLEPLTFGLWDQRSDPSTKLADIFNLHFETYFTTVFNF